MTAESKTSVPVRNSTHILIVDDNREAGKSLAQMLTDSGCDEIRTVRSAARALAIAATFQPAIAFLGIPTPDGLEGNLAALLQKNAREKNIRLIGLTDLAEPPGREEARALGVERFISKPVTQLELDKALRKSPGA
ncbi:MAG TPA: response regulator [Steroidobacteraceae bacterium]